MTTIHINIILEKYKSLLNNELSYSDADIWSLDMINKLDSRELQFQPPEQEKLIIELIIFLCGIDIPTIDNGDKMMISHIDIIDFLKKKNIYDEIVNL